MTKTDAYCTIGAALMLLNDECDDPDGDSDVACVIRELDALREAIVAGSIE